MATALASLDADVVAWYDRLKADPKMLREVSVACRLYAFHLDTYLNAGIRKRPIPFIRMAIHMQEEVDDKHGLRWQYHFTNVPGGNPHCTIKRSPFHDFKGRDVTTMAKFMPVMRKYLEKAEVYCQMMDTVLRKPQASFLLTSPLRVYRGIKLRRPKPDPEGHEAMPTIIPQFEGYTSTSTSLEKAEDILFGGVDPFDYDTHVPIMLVIDLPPGTRVIAMNLCTIQQEEEILVLDQGYIVPRDEAEINVGAPWRPMYGLEEGQEVWMRMVEGDLVSTAPLPPRFKRLCV